MSNVVSYNFVPGDMFPGSLAPARAGSGVFPTTSYPYLATHRALVLRKSDQMEKNKQFSFVMFLRFLYV